jgi:hypothetical protein
MFSICDLERIKNSRKNSSIIWVESNNKHNLAAQKNMFLFRYKGEKVLPAQAPGIRRRCSRPPLRRRRCRCRRQRRCRDGRLHCYWKRKKMFFFNLLLDIQALVFSLVQFLEKENKMFFSFFIGHWSISFFFTCFVSKKRKKCFSVFKI